MADRSEQALPTGETVLGTRIHELEAVSRRPWLVSDLHVGAEVPTSADGGCHPVVAALRRVFEAAAREGADRVVILGDLYDAYLGAAQHGRGGFGQLEECLRQAAAEGLDVSVLHGNRDFLLGRAFEDATGARVVAGGLRLRVAVDVGGAEQRLVLLHGDELCQNDRPYQRFKRIVRSPVARGLAHILPGSITRRIAARARGASARAMAAEAPATLRFEPTAEAVDAALALGETLVFGHIHRPSDSVRAGGRVCVLPAFDATGVGLRWRGGGGLRFFSAEDPEGEMAFEPREFPR